MAVLFVLLHFFSIFASVKTKCLVIGIVMGFAFVACSPSVKVVEPVEGPTSELAAIDSLMWQRPDSALAQLQRFAASPAADSLDEFNGHYCQVLISELLYKNDYKQTNRPDLLQSVTYFDSLMQVPEPAVPEQGRRVEGPFNYIFLDARAHYINGVGYYEQGEMVPACQEYMKALEIMEDQFEEKDLIGHKARFVALTYTRLSSLFSDTYLHEQAIYFAQLSLVSNQKLDVPKWHIARMLCEIGVQYHLLEQLDSADYYYKSAAKVLNDTNSLLHRDISTQQTCLLYKRRGITENTLTKLHYLINQANSETECLLRFLTIGGVFYKEKQLDSAWYYLNKVYNNTKSIASKKQAAEWLVEICKIQGRNAETLEYANFLVPFANQEENQSEVKSQLTELYNLFRQASLSRQHQQMVKKHMTIGLLIIVGLIVGLLAYVILYHKNRKRKQFLEKQIREEQISHDMKQKALSGRLKQSNQRLQETLKRIEDQEAEHKTAENKFSYGTFDERYTTFKQSQICLEILNVVNNLHDNIRNTLKTNTDITEYKAFALSLSQTAQLTKTVEMFFPKLYTTLKAKYASLDRKEWLHCCLYLLQLDKMSICVLLQEPYYTCRRYTLKMEEKFDCRQGLATFIIEQAKSY